MDRICYKIFNLKLAHSLCIPMQERGRLIDKRYIQGWLIYLAERTLLPFS